MVIRVGVHVHAEPAQMHATLAALRAHTPPVELWLLPDGPDALTRDALSAIHDVPQLSTDDPHGAPACFNRLTQSGGADVFVLLESGSLPAPGWLSRLLDALRGDPRHGLAGPSTNLAWNDQGVFPGAPAALLVETAQEAERCFGDIVRPLTPLHSLADFCYAVRRDVVEAVGVADEAYGLGPCWEMDYNIRAARAGFLGVWVGSAYVHRAPFTLRRRVEEARWFEANRRRYQDKFCARRLRGDSGPYENHCKGEACLEFAPPSLIRIREPAPSAAPKTALPEVTPHVPPPEWRSPVTAGGAPLVSCIMPTYNRRAFVPQAIKSFLRQEFSDAELVILDDGTDPVGDCVPAHPRVRYYRSDGKRPVGAKRNEACRLARGALIAHWDDDDWYASSRLGRQVEALRSGAELCGSSQLYFYQPAADRGWRYQHVGTDRILVGTSLMYRKQLWERSPFPEIQIGEDVRFVRAAAAPACDLSDPSLWVGIVHDGNTSPKFPDAVYWHEVPASELRALLGDDLVFFRGLAGPTVSCIMPTFNRRAFVPLSIACFLEQDYGKKELIIVDDGSDPIGDLLAGKPSVRHLRLPYKYSIGQKRNIAAGEAAGQIIVHWDDDDWYGPDRLTRQVEPIASGSAEITGIGLRWLMALPAGEFWSVSPQLHQRMFVGNVHGGTLAYSRAVWAEGSHYPDANLAEDAAFLNHALRRGSRLTHIPNDDLFVYTRHSRNAWAFPLGSYLDPHGWTRTVAPSALSPHLISRYQDAAQKDL